MDFFNKGIKSTINPAKDLKNTYGKNNPVEQKHNQNHDESENMENELAQETVMSDNSEQDIETKLENAVKNSSLGIDAFDGSEEVVKEEAQTLHKEIEALEFKIDELEQEREKLKDQVLRIQAEFDNQRRRFAKERQETIEYANEKLLTKFLEISDTTGLALEAARKATDTQSIITGIEMLAGKITKLFEEAGVKQMDDPIGKEFNFNIHEAISTMPSEEIEEGNVAGVYQHGYYLGEKVLRHARVITSSGK